MKRVMSRVQETTDGFTYQGAQLLKYNEDITSNKDRLIESVLACLKDRVHHPQLLKDALTFFGKPWVGKICERC